MTDRPMVTVPQITMPPYPPVTASPSPSPSLIPMIPDEGISSRIKVPAKTMFLINQDTKAILATVDRMTENGRNPNLMIEGPQGTGKSELAAQYAATRNRPLAVIEIGRVSDPGAIFGYLDLVNGETKFIQGLFTQAITTPMCVVHLQEINRPETDKGLNALFSVLDDNQRSIWIDEMKDYIRVAPGVTFFASMNEGFEFVGTMPLDEALKSRFHFKLHLDTLPHAQELALLKSKSGLDHSQASNIMTAVTTLRTGNQSAMYVSTRDVMNIADLVGYELPLPLAIQSVLGGATDVMETMRLGNHMRGVANNKKEENYEYISSS